MWSCWKVSDFLNQPHGFIYNVFVETARLVSKAQEDSDAKSGLLRYLLRNIHLSLERWQLEQRIKRVMKER